MLINGRIDELVYERKALDQSLPFLNSEPGATLVIARTADKIRDSPRGLGKVCLGFKHRANSR
jgi:hypothetical protein